MKKLILLALIIGVAVMAVRIMSGEHHTH